MQFGRNIVTLRLLINIFVMAKTYLNIEEESVRAQEPPIGYEMAFTIPVHVPTIGDYTVERLSDELSKIAIQLVMQSNTSRTSRSKKEYSQRLQRLRSMSHNYITPQEVIDDERLAYLLSK